MAFDFTAAFTSVSFGKPSARVFRFSPPPGAKVTTTRVPAASPDTKDPARAAEPGSAPKVIGTGWTAVVELSGLSLPAGAQGSHEGRDRSSTADQLAAVRRAMTPVSGAFGSGQVLRTKLVTLLLLDDGRAFVGAVSPDLLERAAAQ